jgi:CubicO group peptidase (beta-lactamase class C family)
MTWRRGTSRTVVIVLLTAVAAGLIWWVVTAGALTVYRIVVHNASGVDDYRLFPQRLLRASSTPFRFSQAAAGGGVLPASLAEAIETNDTLAFLAIHDDRVVFERYFQGQSADQPILAFSVAKSFIGALVGIALQEGLLRSVADPITRYVPELERVPGFSAVTLHHLLQMTSGIAYTESDWPFSAHPRFYYTDHLEAEALSLTLAEPPGLRFQYRSSDTILLTIALKRVLMQANPHRTVTDYVHERLWEPLGMEDDGAWSVDHAPNGLEKTGCCLRATPRDVAKLGRLYLNGGAWEGRRILPSAWIDETTRAEMDRDGSWEYQNHWWRVSRTGHAFAGRGHLGQFLYVDPDRRVILVRMGRGLGALGVRAWDDLLAGVAQEVS